MDVELLISKVCERPPLWDKWDRQHANRNVVEKLWTEISRGLDCEEVLVRRKWKYLRDQYAVELGKHPPARPGEAGGATHASKWRYFQALHFLKDVVKPRASSVSSVAVSDAADTTTCPAPPRPGYQTDDVDSEEGTSASPAHTSGGQGAERDRCASASSHRKRRGCGRRPSKSKQYSAVDTDRQQIQFFIEKSSRRHEDKDEDEDLLFFKSLLPHVKRIPAASKLTFRGRIHELVQLFAYQEPMLSGPSNACTSPSSASAQTP